MLDLTHSEGIDRRDLDWKELKIVVSNTMVLLKNPTISFATEIYKSIFIQAEKKPSVVRKEPHNDGRNL